MESASYRYRTELAPGASIGNALLSHTEERPYRSPAEPMSGTADNDWLDKGFAIHEYPCRRHFRAEQRIENVAFERDASKMAAHLALDNPRLERSGFWHTATYLKTEGLFFLEPAGDAAAPGAAAEGRAAARSGAEGAEQAGSADAGSVRVRFRMSTCGGARIRINGRLAAALAPYSRNTHDSIEFEAELHPGENEVRFVFDDLAERDTLYFLALEYLEGPRLVQSVPVSAPPEELTEAREVLAGARFARSAFTEGAVTLELDRPPAQDMRLRCQARTGFVEREGEGAFDLWLPAGTRSAGLGPVDAFGPGYIHFVLSHPDEDVRLFRVLHADIYPIGRAPEPAQSVTERKEQALRYVAEHGGAIAHRSLARIHLAGGAGAGQPPSAAGAGFGTGAGAGAEAKLLRSQLDEIDARFDCSDFYLVALLWIWYRYGERISDELRSRIETSALGFRY